MFLKIKKDEKFFGFQALKEKQFIFTWCNTIIVNNFIAGGKKSESLLFLCGDFPAPV